MTMPDLGNPSTYAAGFPYGAIAELRKNGPVAWIPEPESPNFAGGPGFWYLMGQADVMNAGRRPEIFSSEEGGTWVRNVTPQELLIQRQGMLNIDPPMHTSMRKIINKAFTPRVVQGMAESISKHADALIASLGDGGDIDWVEKVSSEMPLLVLAVVAVVVPALLATDPGSSKDFAAFARQTGNELVSQADLPDNAFEFFLRRK